MQRFIVFGHRQHGKDTACEYLRGTFGLSFISSSQYACQTFLYEQMRESYGYASMEACFNDRDHHRQYWYEAIRAYNEPNLARLGTGIFSQHSVYCGIRDLEEYRALRAANMVDLVIFVDASERKPLEPTTSMKLTRHHADLIVDNNGTLGQLQERLYRLFTALGYVPLG